MSGQGFSTGDGSLSQHGASRLERHFDLPLLADRLLALTARLTPGLRTLDDAYITYRYTRNILAGNGFVFNPGERELGTTTPLYTLLLAAATTHLEKRYSLASVTAALAILLIDPLVLDGLPDYIMLIFVRNP